MAVILQPASSPAGDRPRPAPDPMKTTLRVLFFALPLALAALALRPLYEAAVAPVCRPGRIVLGVNEQGAPDPELVHAANLRHVRITIPWRDVNPAQGVWSWQATDEMVAAHRSAGHAVLAVLSTAPGWAGSNANGTRPPENAALWRELVGRVAQRYRGRIEAYEIWNEPDHRDGGIGVGWDGSLFESTSYALYVREAALAIREHDPDALVVAPVLGSEPRKATAELWRSLTEVALPGGSAGELIDVVSIHANGEAKRGDERAWRRIEGHLRLLLAHGRAARDKPVWITEAGWPSSGAGEDGQMEHIRSLARRLGEEWKDVAHPHYCGADRGELRLYLYKERDTPGETRGIHRGDGTPKPVVIEWLRNLPEGGVIVPGEGSEASD